MKRVKNHQEGTPHKSSVKKTYQNVKSYMGLLSPAKRHSRGFNELLMDEEEGRKEKSELAGMSVSGLVEEKMIQYRIKEDPFKVVVKNTEVSQVIKDYLIYSEVSFYSDLPFDWIKESDIISAGESVPVTPPRLIWNMGAGPEQVMALVNRCLNDALSYYHYKSRGVLREPEEQRRNSVCTTFVSLADSFTSSGSQCLFFRNKLSLIVFHHNSAYFKRILQLNPELHKKAQEKRGEGKRPAPAESHPRPTESFACIANTPSNYHWIQKMEAAGKSRMTQACSCS